MKNLMKKLRKNKGFTLVELIIVVAIIAILASVLAPQYLQYVERARESNDLQVATSIMRAATVATADPQVGASGTYTVTWTTSGTPTLKVTHDTDTASATKVQKSIGDVMGWATAEGTSPTTTADKAESSNGQTAFAFTIDTATGAITLTGDDTIAKWGEAGIGVNP